MDRLRHPDRSDIACSEQPRQAQRITVVDLDMSGRRRDLRWRNHKAVDSDFLEFAVQRVAARTSLIDTLDRAVPLLEFAQDRDHGRWLAIHVANKAHFPVSAWFSNRDRHGGLVHIHSHKQRCFVHDEPRLECGCTWMTRGLHLRWASAKDGHIIWRVGRAGPSTSMIGPSAAGGSAFSGPASGVAGGRGTIWPVQRTRGAAKFPQGRPVRQRARSREA